MEFKDPGRRRRLVLIVLGVTLALAAGFGAFQLASTGNQSAQVIREAVLVAARDIPARTPITPDDVTIRQVPIDEVLAQSYREVGQVVGRLTSIPIYADQQITPNLFATTTADAEFSILGPDEVVTEDSPVWRAVAVQIPDDRAVGGEIRAGQHVDLIVSVAIEVLAIDPEGNYQVVETATQEGLQSGKATKLTFQDLEVLKSDTDSQLYLLKVDLHQAEQIAHVIQEAPDSFTLVLRPDEDTRAVNALEYGETTDRLVMRYLYPVPRLIDLTQLIDLPLPGGQPTVPTVPSPSPTAGPEDSPGPDQSPGPDASPTPAS